MIDMSMGRQERVRGQRNEVHAKELAKQRPEGRAYKDRCWDMGQEIGRDQLMPRNLIFWELEDIKLRNELHQRGALKAATREDGKGRDEEC